MDSGQSLLKSAGMVLLAMAVIGVIDNLVIYISAYVGLWQFHVTRSAIAVPLTGVMAWVLGQRLLPLRVRAVALRSILITGSMILYFGCLAFLPIAEVTAGMFTAPIFVLLISAMFFGVKVGPVRVFSGVLGFIGILLIQQPGTEDFSVLTLVPVAAGFLYALNAVVTHHMCREESTAALQFWFFLLIGGVSALISLALEVHGGGENFFTMAWQPLPATTLGMIAAQAVGAIFGIGLLTRAYQGAEASYVSIFEYSLLIFAGVVAYFMRGELPGALALAGIALIVIAGALIALRSR